MRLEARSVRVCRLLAVIPVVLALVGCGETSAEFVSPPPSRTAPGGSSGPQLQRGCTEAMQALKAHTAKLKELVNALDELKKRKPRMPPDGASKEERAEYERRLAAWEAQLSKLNQGITQVRRDIQRQADVVERCSPDRR